MSDAEQVTTTTAVSRLEGIEEAGFDIKAVFSALWRRKWQYVVFVCLLMMPIAALVLNLPPKYTATATVLIDPKQILAVSTNPVVNAVSGDEVSLQTEIEILRSSKLAQSIIEKFDLVSDSEFSGEQSGIGASVKASFQNLLTYVLPTSPNAEGLASNGGDSQGDLSGQQEHIDSRPYGQRLTDALERYYKRLSVVQSGKSRAILVSFTAEFPEKAATIANSVVDSYVERQFDSKVSSSERAG
ncbi:MAG: Wzz/FepE/Etk N-terminal domain-containing protein, partial [Geminicoccaceae bacterium]